MRYKYDKAEVEIIKELGTFKNSISKKTENWVQVEYKTGDNKGSRVPATKEELKSI